MATTDKLQKREKSRRVWRLNKKEGIPVMEALDSVGISKDVYYRFKNEHEDEWENEITTAEELEDKLQELKRKTNNFDDRLEEWRDEAQEAQRKAGELDMAENWYAQVKDIQDKMISIENLLVDEGVEVPTHIRSELNDLEEQVSQVDGRVNEYLKQAEEAREFMEELEAEQEWYEKVEDIEDKMEDIEGLLQKEGLDVSDINTSLGDLDRRLDGLDEQVEGLSNEISQLEGRIDEIQDEQENLNARLLQVEQREQPESIFDLL
jgi:chromosome segregation ATPase